MRRHPLWLSLYAALVVFAIIIYFWIPIDRQLVYGITAGALFVFSLLLIIISFQREAEDHHLHQTIVKLEQSKTILIGNIPGLVYRCRTDHDYTMLFVSEGCYELTGYRPEDLLFNQTITFNELILPEYRKVVWNFWKEAQIEKKRIDLEYPILTKDGIERWVYEQGIVLFDEDLGEEVIEGIILDIDQRKKDEAKIRYLSQHDVLTELFNRSYFEQELRRIEEEKQPVTLVYGDINGLKLINDVFGHEAGDRLLKRIASILNDVALRHHCMAARIGGDEFAMVVYDDNEKMVLEMVREISDACSDNDGFEGNASIAPSIALGWSAYSKNGLSVMMALQEAENQMYKHKLVLNRSYHANLVTALRATLHEKSHNDSHHETFLLNLGERFASAMGFTLAQKSDFSLLLQLHDIGKVSIDNELLHKSTPLNPDELRTVRSYVESGYRIAASVSELRSVAEYLLCQQERWDGTGYPQGLKGEAIPLLSRALAILKAYDAMITGRPYRQAKTKKEAIHELKEQSGKQFDAELVKLFIALIQREPVA